MDWLYFTLLAGALVIGLLINIVGLPGIWVMIAAAALYAWATGGAYIGLWGLALLVGIGVLAEIVEFIAGGAAAKTAGGSTRAMWGALLGGVVGAFLFTIPIPGIGTIIGACLGAFVGAILAELTVRGDTAHSFRIGVAAARGKFWGIISKLAFSAVILLGALWMAWPYGAPLELPPDPGATRPAETLPAPIS